MKNGYRENWASGQTWCKDAADESDRESLALTFSYTVGEPEEGEEEARRCRLGDRFFNGLGLDETHPVVMREKKIMN